MSSLINSISPDPALPGGGDLSGSLLRVAPAHEGADDLAQAAGLVGGDQEHWQRIVGALRELYEGFALARSLGRKDWDFAVEIDQLQRSGLRANDLRWLIFKGWVCHGYETSGPVAADRRFTVGGPNRFDRTSCFVLSQAGVTLLERQRPSGDPGSALPAIGLELPTPRWDQQRQELRVAQYLIKRFKVPACTQCAILSAFEEENWPARIDDPLSGHRELDRKRRLHNAINALNRNRIHPLVRFLGDGRGQGVRWEFQPAPSPCLKLG